MNATGRGSFGQLSTQGAERLQQIEARMRSEIPLQLQRLNELQRTVDAAGAAPSTHARRELADAAHRLRGRAGMLRMTRLCEAAAELEKHAEAEADAALLRIGIAACELAWQDAATC